MILAEPMPMMDAPPEHDQLCQAPAGSGGHNHHKTAHNTEHSDDVPSVVKDIAPGGRCGQHGGFQ